ncbi:MAG: insulinase family protein [Marinifilaceae bacterium]
MRKITSLLSLAFVLMLTSFASAQQPNLHQPVPMDKAVRKGVLPNGLTYYIRHNEEPKNRASFYIMQNVGALLENDDQNGLAHFLEHMAFNGTKNFPGKEMLNTMEKNGVKFGSNINAYTAFNETVYNLSEVPTDKPELIDNCILVLHDWANDLLLTGEEIDSERGVISEEWRTRRTANFRMRNKYFPVLFKGSKWAERDVIGDLNIIKNFKYKTIRDFYHDWYRTDLQAIAIVGDIDVDVIEAKVKALFSKIPAVKNARKRPVFEVPSHEEMYYVLATDKEATTSNVGMTIMHQAAKVKDLASLKEQYQTNLYNMMLRARISEIMQKGENACVNASSNYGGFVRGYEAYSIDATAKPNKEAEAFKLIYTETERVKRHGFLPSELERAKANLLSSLETQFKGKDKISNDSYARMMKSDYMEGEVATDPTFDFQFGNFAVQSSSLEEINALSAKWLTKENRTIIVSGPSKGVKHITEAEIKQVIADIEASTISAYEDNTSGQALIEEGSIKGGKVVSTKELSAFGATEWTLSNGAKVVFRKADHEKDEIKLKAWSIGGSSLYENKDIVNTKCIGDFAGTYGVGDFDASTLKKLLAGKKVGVYPYLNSLEEGFNGFSTPKDFETMLQLLYLNFEKPRFDASAHKALVGRYAAYFKSMEGNPKQAQSDSITRIFTNYNKRTKLQNAEYIKEIDLKRIEEIYKDRFSDASDFTFMIVGNLEKAEVKTLVEKYIGALTDKDRTEKWIDRKVSSPEGLTVKRLTFPMETDKGTVIIKMFKDTKYNAYNRIALTMVKDILNLRYTEEVREKEGGTYGVGVYTNFSQFPTQEATLYIQFDCDPEKADHLKAICYKEIDKLIKNGPSEKDLNKVILNLKKNREQSKLHNKYWSNAIRNFYYHGENTVDPTNYEEILDKMTTKKIRKVAKKFFKRINKVDVTVLPKK